MKVAGFFRTLCDLRALRFRCALLVLTLPGVATAKPTIDTFDVPGAGTGPGQGTFALGINPSGEIEGYYVDSNNVNHGFLRTPTGTIVRFDVPLAGTDAGQGTLPESINPAGAITGAYTDGAGLTHGFVRSPEGTITTFDAPGAAIPPSLCSPGIICSNGTQAAAINTAGAISGQVVDANGIYHGFLRSPDGTITTFDAVGAGTNPGQGTFVTFTDGLNQAGEVAGGYADNSGTFHPLVRAADGSITAFLPPGAGNQPGQGANNSGVNSVGTVTSYLIDENNVDHGYLRSRDGSFTTFDVPGAGTAPGEGTLPLNINSRGDVVGAYIDAAGGLHGFLRHALGTIVKFDPPASQGTIPVCNNPANAISGYYFDEVGAAHGFLRTP